MYVDVCVCIYIWLFVCLYCRTSASKTGILDVEYAERKRKYGILFIFSLFREYIYLEYVRVPIIYRDSQAEYGIHILVATAGTPSRQSVTD